jgi:tetratricopeptide (TPR) repeat protein
LVEKLVKIVHLSLLILVVACAATKIKDSQKRVRKYIESKDYQKAFLALEESEIKKNEQARLLYFMERGRLFELLGDYKESTRSYSKAIELVDKYYTKSIKEKILSSVIHETNEKYYGSLHEVSGLFYAQAKSFLMLYLQKENKKWLDKEGKLLEKPVLEKINQEKSRQFLFSARATVVKWDSFFKDIQRGSEKSFFREDPLNKIFAAKVHELVGTRSDRQIALNLYKDAHRLLHTYGHTLKTYQDNYENFSKKVWENLKKKKKIKFPKTGTVHFQQTNAFLDERIYELTSSVRKNQLKKTIKRYQIDTKKMKKKTNVSILIEKKLIQPVEAKNYSYGLASAARNAKDPSTRALIQGVGIPIVTYFALGPLGLGTVSKVSGNTYLYSRHNIGTTMVGEVGIEFELPIVKESKVEPLQEIVIISKETNQEVARRALPIIAPRSDIAYQLNKEKSTGLFTTKGVRVALKHLAAIITAYKTYQVSGGDDNALARFTALATYLAGTKAIAASESADTRHWTSFPANIHMQQFNLEQGEYIVKLSKEQQGTNIAEIKVDSSENFFSYSL